MTRITPCLWFDTEGEEAAAFYVSLFKNARITDVSRYGEAGPRPAGSVMVVSFELDGQPFTALNGGPEFTFSRMSLSLALLLSACTSFSSLFVCLSHPAFDIAPT